VESKCGNCNSPNLDKHSTAYCEEIHRWWEREVHFDLTDTSPIIVNLNVDSDSSDEEHLNSDSD
jgi:hypothetical protein